VTITYSSPRVAELRHLPFRLATLLFAVLLGAYSIWLQLAEFSRTGIDALPTDAKVAAAASKERDSALWAASVGAIRGDLWAESAFTYADLIFDQAAANTSPDVIATAAGARDSIDRALSDAPHRSSVWLLLAGVSLRVRSAGVDPLEALKMSYYTGPSEQSLIPLRLRIATRADRFDDVQMRGFATRELRALLSGKQNSAIAEAYNIASPAGKLFIEQTVGEVDPALLKTLRAGNAATHSIPN
jgi:hypothetical protein